MLRRVHTTFDLLEGHLLIALLREHGVEAWLFDADFVRQNWFEQIAYGGFRVMVRDDDIGVARDVLQDYSAGRLALEGEHAETCPHCARAAGNDDPQPRRNVFLVSLVLGLAADIRLFRWSPSRTELGVAIAVQLVLNIVAPWLIVRYFKWRLRCADCGHRWRQPPRHYAELMRMAEAEQP